MIATTQAIPAPPRRIRIAAFLTTGVFCVMMLGSALLFLTGPAEVIRSFQSLGYPDYLRPFLGVAKLAGVIALAAPRVPRTLREWAYAGFAFDIVGALVSHANTGATAGDIARVVFALALLFTSYLLRRSLAGKEV